MTAKDIWVFRIVQQDTGKPAPGVPVTVLDQSGNPLAHLASDANGRVELPRRPGPRLRLRVGLRSEEPIELNTALLGDEPTDLVAPSRLPELHVVSAEAPLPATRAQAPAAAALPAASEPVPPHVVYFQRLVMFAEAAPQGAPVSQAEADFFALATPEDTTLRYGVVVEVEESWQSQGVQWGELLHSVSLTPGDEARLAVLDGRWRKDTDGRERPIQILARMVGPSMLGDLVTSLRAELMLDPLTVADPALDAAATETVQLLRERTERQSHALRRRPLGLVEAPADAPATAAVRHRGRAAAGGHGDRRAGPNGYLHRPAAALHGAAHTGVARSDHHVPPASGPHPRGLRDHDPARGRVGHRPGARADAAGGRRAPGAGRLAV